MIELTPEQCQELAAAEPVAINPNTQEEYVLVRKKVYQLLRMMLDEDGPDMRAVGQLVDKAMREDDEHDPTLGFYQKKYGPSVGLSQTKTQ